MKRLYYLLFNPFFRLCILSFQLRGMWRIWHFVFMAIFVLLRYRSAILAKNLAIAFDDSLNLKQRKKLKYQVYRFLSYEICYFLRLSTITPEQLQARTRIVADKECLELASKKLPLILLSGHTLGVWAGVLFAACFRRVFTYTYHGPQKQNYAVYSLFQKLTKIFNFTLIPQSKSDVFAMRRALKDKHCLSIVGDLNVIHTSTFVNFFGKQAAIGEGAFRLALKTKTPIVFAHIAENAKKEIVFSLKQIYDPQQTPAPSLQELACRFTQELEQVIRLQPACYFWVNKRWKTRPEGDNQKIYS